MPCVAFFGATGGCTLAVLVRTLNAGIDAVALARTPSKLLKMLDSKGVSESAISKHLTIIEGNAKDVSLVRKALVYPKEQTRLCDIIVSGVGATPSLRFALNPVGMDDPHVCEEVSRAVVTALKELQNSGVTGKPIVTAISTTGLSKQRDVPLAYYHLYHWLLVMPHVDKKEMERQYLDLASEKSSPIRGFIAVKPTLLTDGKEGKGNGLDKVRVGWEGPKETAPGPAIGYTIARDDVGAWIFENIVESPQSEQWIGRKVSLTY